jgi:hypothetical protein
MDPVYTISPRLLATLYYRCIRCLYDHVRTGEDPHVPGSSFRATAVAALEAAKRPDGWIEIPGAPPVRVISDSIRPESAPIPFPEFGFQLAFAPHPATVLETQDGKHILCAYRQREANAALRSVLSSSLEAAALAAHYPGEPGNDLPHIDGLGIVEFAMRLSPSRKGTSHKVFRPVRYIALRYEPERFEMFLRVVARILSSRKPPPPSADCPHCAKARAGDKVPA